MMAAAGKDKCHQFADVICLNRYYGWYMQGGYQLIGAKKAFIDEMNQWMNTEPNKPFLFTEYVADTDAGAHKLPSVQWSEEYQCEYLTMQHEVFDMFEAVVGEQPLGQRNARLLVGGGADLADAGEIGEAERRAQRAVEIEQGLEETALAVAARAQQVIGVLQMVAHERRRRDTAQHAGVVHVRGDCGGRLEAQDGAVARELLVVQRHRPRRIEPRIVGHDDLTAAQQTDIGEADARLEDGQPGMFGERGPDELVVPLVPLLRQREQVRGGPPAVLPARPQLPLGVEGQLRIAGQGQAQHVRGLDRALQLAPGMADGVGDADRPAVAAEEVEFLRQRHAGQPLDHTEPVAVHDAADHGEVLIRHRRERREIQLVRIVHDCVSSFGEGKASMRSVSGTHSGSRWIKRKSVFRPMAVGAAMGFSLALPGFQGRAVEVVGVDSHGVRTQPVDPDAHAAAHGRHVVGLDTPDIRAFGRCVHPREMIHRPTVLSCVFVDAACYVSPRTGCAGENGEERHTAYCRNASGHTAGGPVSFMRTRKKHPEPGYEALQGGARRTEP